MDYYDRKALTFKIISKAVEEGKTYKEILDIVLINTGLGAGSIDKMLISLGVDLSTFKNN